MKKLTLIFVLFFVSARAQETNYFSYFFVGEFIAEQTYYSHDTSYYSDSDLLRIADLNDLLAGVFENKNYPQTAAMFYGQACMWRIIWAMRQEELQNG